MAPKTQIVKIPASKETLKTVKDFLKKNKVSLAKVKAYDLYGVWSDLKPWNHDIYIEEGEVISALEILSQKEREARDKLIRANLPDEVWIMYYSMSNSLGSIAHVSQGDGFYLSEEECQHAIDTMNSWIGMGPRDRYRPMKIVNGLNKVD